MGGFFIWPFLFKFMKVIVSLWRGEINSRNMALQQEPSDIMCCSSTYCLPMKYFKYLL